MRTKLTGSLIVCLAAAAFTAGALLLNQDSPGPAPVAMAADATADASPTSTPGGAYRTPARGSPAGAPAGNPARLEIQGFAFSAVTAGRRGGVAIQNRDGVPHTVTADNGGFDSGRVAPIGTARIVAPAAPGNYRFTCLIHPQMSGTLVVR